jgi:ketosteroid isomerase-like protein
VGGALETTRGTAEGPEPLRSFLTALADRDWERLRECFAPDVRFRALIPSALADPAGREDVVGRFKAWFDDGTDFEMVSSEIRKIVDRLHVSYRIHTREEGIWYWVEQQAYCEVRDGGITLMNLLCSGFRAESSPQ